MALALLRATPHVPMFCERHDGPAVLRAEDSVCCEHADADGGVCCYCRTEKES